MVSWVHPDEGGEGGGSRQAGFYSSRLIFARFCSHSQNTRMKHAPRQAVINKKNRYWAVSLMELAMQLLCHYRARW